jgi:hypothetical protein
MKENTEKNTTVLLNSELFSEFDLCELSIELFNDIIFHNSPDYIKISIGKTGLAGVIYKLLVNQEFKTHPLRILLEENIETFDTKNIKEFLQSRFYEIPGFSLFVMKHDDKRATVFIEAKIYAAVGQLKSISKDAYSDWIVNVKTSVGNFRIN